MKEIWKDIKGYKGEYQVSNLGRIKSLSRRTRTFFGTRLTTERILQNQKTPKSYEGIMLGDRKTAGGYKWSFAK